jgi:hypothetical protein
LAYGLGLRATRAPRDMCRGIPGHKSLRPHSMWSHPWANVAGYPDRASTGRGLPGPFHIEVWGRAQTGRKPGDIYA